MHLKFIRVIMSAHEQQDSSLLSRLEIQTLVIHKLSISLMLIPKAWFFFSNRNKPNLEVNKEKNLCKILLVTFV